jgi:hypothetical protein
MSQQNAAKWCAHFITWQISMDNCNRSGRPTRASTPDKKTCEKHSSRKQKNSDQWHITKLESVPWNSYQDHLGVWIPQGVYMMGPAHSENHKVQGMACALSLLQQYSLTDHKFLERFVTGDETWVHHHTPETKCASMESKHPGFPQLKKITAVKSAGSDGHQV